MTSYTADATPSRYYCDKSAYLSHVLLEGLLGLKASRVRRLQIASRGFVRHRFSSADSAQTLGARDYCLILEETGLDDLENGTDDAVKK